MAPPTRGKKKEWSGRNSRPRAISKEENVILPVNEYKLPAWSQWVLQQAFQPKHSGQLTP